MSRGKYITEEEVQFVKVNCTVMSISEMAEKLGRNYWSIHRVMQRQGLSINHKFTAQEDNVIRKLYPVYNIRTIATMLHLDEASIYNRAKKLKLRKTKERERSARDVDSHEPA